MVYECQLSGRDIYLITISAKKVVFLHFNAVTHYLYGFTVFNLILSDLFGMCYGLLIMVFNIIVEDDD